MHTAFLTQPTSETELESCVALLGKDNNFMGIVCLRINALG